MITLAVRIRLAVFLLVAVASTIYAVLRFTGVAHLVRPPYTVTAEFTAPGGIYPRAEVDLLGTPVGSVSQLRLADDGNTLVDMTINHGEHIPANVTATVTERSALGEQYVELTPRRADGPLLHDRSRIPASATSGPIPVEDLLAHLNAFAASVPTKDLTTDLRELATAFGGTGPDLQHLLDDSNALTRTGLANLKDQINLINSSKTVLDTQLAEGDRLTTFLHQYAGLTDELRSLDPTFAQTFAGGIQAGQQVTSLLADNAAALPQLLDQLIAITDVSKDRLPGLRKSLVLLPWDLQSGMGTIRYCDNNDPRTGQPIPSTCHYDPRTGKPLYTSHFGLELPQKTGANPADPCTNGYQTTTKYLPNGQPASGTGPAETPDTPANRLAYCAANPGDPNTPNVRGSQNAQRPPGDTTALPSGAPGASPQGTALYDPNSGTVVTSGGQAYQLSGESGPPPPHGTAGLAWLLTEPLSA